MTERSLFYYVGALASSGKTYQALNYAVKRAHYDHQKTVIVLKSKLLMTEALETAIAFKRKHGSFVDITAINSDHLVIDQDGNPYSCVNAAIIDYLKNSQNRIGEVLLITEAAFLQLPYWPKRWNWHCICDEIPNVTPAHTLNIPDNHKMLTKHLDLESSTASHSLVSAVGDQSVLKAYADNKNRDQISKYFTPIAEQILSDNYDVYTLTSSYQRVLNNDSLRGAHQLQFFSLLKPSIFGSGKTIGDDDGPKDTFASVTIMGACFKDSLLYYLWPHMGAEFEPHDEICSNLRFEKHDCGHRLEIKYVFEEKWSKRKRDRTQKVGSEELSGLDIVLAAIKTEFGENEFVYMVNKDAEVDVKQKLSATNSKQIPNSPFGLNCYQHIHQAAVLSALNATPAHYSFLAEMGVDADAVREGQYHQSCYQAIMRTSLRNKDATENVKVIVSDKSAALSLQELFVGSNVSSIITGIEEPAKRRIGRPSAKSKKSRADIEKQARAKKKRIRKMIAEANAGIQIDVSELNAIVSNCRSDNQDLPQLKLLISSTSSCAISSNSMSQTNEFSIPVFKSIFSSQADAHMQIDIRDVDALIAQLKQASKTPLTDKHKNTLISTTEFRSDLSDETNRGLDNISRIWGVWLDIDGGDMPNNEIPKLFPDLRMAVFNSYSIGNYRIFIPTTSCMSIGEYKEIMQIILHRVEAHTSDAEILMAKANGHEPRTYVSNKKAQQQIQRNQIPSPMHGIDLSKLNPSSLFYMPSLCGDDPSSSFFHDYDGEQRHVLDHQQWLDKQTLGIDEIEELFLQEEVQQYQQAIKPKSTQQTNTAHGNDNTQFDPKAVIEKAMDDYRAIPDGQGRHKGFFVAISRIHHKAAIPLDELEPYMQQCDYDGHQRKQYKQIIKSLAKPQYQPKQNSSSFSH